MSRVQRPWQAWRGQAVQGGPRGGLLGVSARDTGPTRVRQCPSRVQRGQGTARALWRAAGSSTLCCQGPDTVLAKRWVEAA